MNKNEETRARAPRRVTRVSLEIQRTKRFVEVRHEENIKHLRLLLSAKLKQSVSKNIFPEPTPYRCTLLEKGEPSKRTLKVKRTVKKDKSDKVAVKNNNFVLPKLSSNPQPLVSLSARAKDKKLEKPIISPTSTSTEEYFNSDSKCLKCQIGSRSNQSAQCFDSSTCASNTRNWGCAGTKAVKQNTRIFEPVVEYRILPVVPGACHSNERRRDLHTNIFTSHRNKRSALPFGNDVQSLSTNCEKQKQNEQMSFTTDNRTKVTACDKRLSIEVFMPEITNSEFPRI